MASCAHHPKQSLFRSPFSSPLPTSTCTYPSFPLVITTMLLCLCVIYTYDLGEGSEVQEMTLYQKNRNLDLRTLNFCCIPVLLSFKFSSVFPEKRILCFQQKKNTDSWAFLPYAQLNVDKIAFYFRENNFSAWHPGFLSPVHSCPIFQKIIYLQSKDKTK